jgi:hypothetical protein
MPLDPFESWGIDLLGQYTPPVAGRTGISYLQQYATKWVEANATRKNNAKVAANFFFHWILMQFGYSLELVSGQGSPFLNILSLALTQQYYVSHPRPLIIPKLLG